MISATSDNMTDFVTISGSIEELESELYNIVRALAAKNYEKQKGEKFENAPEEEKLISVAAVIAQLLSTFSKVNGFKTVPKEIHELLKIIVYDIDIKLRKDNK